jgi:hypothetical protein
VASDAKTAKKSMCRALNASNQLLRLAMDLLQTEGFKKLESSIKRSALEQLGLDADTDDIAISTLLLSLSETKIRTY